MMKSLWNLSDKKQFFCKGFLKKKQTYQKKPKNVYESLPSFL